MTSPLGVLILHGFTSSRATVAPVIPQAEALDLPWRLPQLRGHWSRPEDLAGVTYADMYSDARASLDELRASVSRVAVIGLSVGGVLGLNLAADQPEVIDSLVVLAPALRFVHPLTRVTPLVATFVKTFKGGGANGFSDPALVTRAGNYEWFPTAAFASIWRAGRQIERRLPAISTPTLILNARRDRVVAPSSGVTVYHRINTREKELVWFERSGHEMLLDCEGGAVAARIGEFLARRKARAAA